jgi:hypothetical protein
VSKSDGQLSASGRDQASARPRHAIRVGSDDHRRPLADEERREPDNDRDQADDCQRMEYTKGAFTMQRQRRHVHDYKRHDVDGSDRSVRVRAFPQEEKNGTRS